MPAGQKEEPAMSPRIRRTPIAVSALAIVTAVLLGSLRDLTAVGAAAATSDDGKAVLHGLWTVGKATTTSLVHLGLRYSLGGNDRQHWGRAIPIADLQGLDPAALERDHETVVFRVVRDAGMIACNGTVGHDEGAGTFDLVLDPSFPAALERRGVGRPSQSEQIRLALADAGFALLDALARHGYPKPDVAGLIRLGEHGAHQDYVDAMAQEGFRLETLSRLVQARDHGVDPHFIRGLRDAGYAKLTYEQLLRARDHGADPDYIAEMRKLGMKDATLEDMIVMRDHGVDADFVAEMRGAGYRNASLEDLRVARDHGVTADFVDDLADAGFGRLPLHHVIRARDHGVTASVAKRGRAELGHDATLDDIITWRDRGGR
jgi:hypothetical protein